MIQYIIYVPRAIHECSSILQKSRTTSKLNRSTYHLHKIPHCHVILIDLKRLKLSMFNKQILRI